MHRPSCWLFGLFLSSFLFGCQIRAPQLEAIQATFEMPFRDLSDYEWTIETIGYKTNALPVQRDKGALFVSYAKDSLTFDGFVLSRIDSLGAYPTPIVIRGSSHLADSSRKVYLRGQLYSQQVCQKRLAIGAVARQICVSKRGREWLYEMEFGDDGQLSRITQSLDEEGRQVSLEKVVR